MAKVYESASELVGKTPLLKLNKIGRAHVWTPVT